MNKFQLLVVALVFSFAANAQTYSLKGILQDIGESKALAGASIKLTALDTTGIEVQAVTDNSGAFLFENLIPWRYQLSITTVGYETVKQSVKIDSADKDLGIVPLSKESKILNEVNVTVQTPPVKQKNDTLEYSANAFKVNPDANAEDMIKKMPGVTVDKGTVTAQGEQVKKVTIDGRDFFGDDATAALRNMPAEVIDKIQVFDRLSDQAQFTGFDDGNTSKSINIVTKANMRSGNFGRVFAGYGTDERYLAGGNVSFFNGDRRLSFVGLSNNVNQQNFASQDLLGATSTPTRSGNRQVGRSGGGGPQGGRGGNFGGGGNTGNFLVGQQSGISTTNSFGINYSNIYAKKLTIAGSYFYNNSNNTNDEESKTENFQTGDSSTFYDENSLVGTKNFNNRVNLRVEYKIDSSNTLLFTPSLNFQNNRSATSVFGKRRSDTNDQISESIYNNSTNTSGYNLSSGLLYRHSFAKRGRTISLNINGGMNNRDGENYLESFSTFFKTGNVITDSIRQFDDQSSSGYNISSNIAYTEPIGAKGQLQFNYTPSFSSSKADQQTFQFNELDGKYSSFDPGLSNKFDNTVTTQNGGVSFRSGDRDNMYSFGLNYQHSNLESEQYLPYATTVDKTFSNLLPNAMVRLKLSAKSNIRLNYRSSTNTPSISQLQDVINRDNPLFVRTGNPELKQQYSNTFFSRYQFTNIAKGQSIFANIFFTNTSDYVGNAVYNVRNGDSVLSPSYTLREGAQLTKPVNMDGYWSLRSFLTFGMPLKFIKSNINWNVGYSYSKIPGMIDKAANFSQNHNYNLGAVLASNISEFVDFNLSYSANFNKVSTTTGLQSNSKYFSHNAGLQMNLLTKKGWFFQNDLNNSFYSGLGDGFNQNFWLWNIAVGKKFLKDQAGELKLSVFDLLKQNNSITRTVTETYIEDVRNQVLQQYFMLTFSYKLKNFIKK